MLSPVRRFTYETLILSKRPAAVSLYFVSPLRGSVGAVRGVASTASRGEAIALAFLAVDCTPS